MTPFQLKASRRWPLVFEGLDLTLEVDEIDNSFMIFKCDFRNTIHLFSCFNFLSVGRSYFKLLLLQLCHAMSFLHSINERPNATSVTRVASSYNLVAHFARDGWKCIVVCPVLLLPRISPINDILSMNHLRSLGLTFQTHLDRYPPIFGAGSAPPSQPVIRVVMDLYAGLQPGSVPRKGTWTPRHWQLVWRRVTRWPHPVQSEYRACGKGASECDSWICIPSVLPPHLRGGLRGPTYLPPAYSGFVSGWWAPAESTAGHCLAGSRLGWP